jgi:hypothetical protein
MFTFAHPHHHARAPRPAGPLPRPNARLAIRQILHGPQLQRLAVSRPDDPAEQEAGRIAERVANEPVQRLCAECEDELEGELRRPTAPGPPAVSSAATVQRAVDFRADFSNVSLASRTAAAIAGDRFTYQDADFSADADIVAIGDTEAELAEWDVGVLQDMVVNWEREYWRRDNADRRGRFVEQKFRPIETRFRDQADGASTLWSDDSEHQDLGALAPTPEGARFRVATTVSTADQPGGDDTVSGEDVTGMDATDGTRNIDSQGLGTRFDTWISAHNTVSGAFRHLRRLNWNYQRSLDFTGRGATLAVGAESGQVGRHGPYGAGKDAPLTAGTTANDAMGDDANWLRRRVDGWS